MFVKKDEGTQNYGWKVKLNHVFPEKRSPHFVPSFKIIFSLLTLIIRYTFYQFWCYIRGRKPVMDYIKTINPEQIYGVPLGGIGGGTIGRGFKGEFCRFQLKPGMYEYDVVDADQFIVTVQNNIGVTVYQNVLSVRDPPSSGNLSRWKWNFPSHQAVYTALFPRSWTEYSIPECKIKLICRQISPVIPHNYKDTSLPGCVFVWSVINEGTESLYVSITMCLKGYKDASKAEPFQWEEDNVKITGMQIFNNIMSMPCTFAFGVKETNDMDVTNACFNPRGSGSLVWEHLLEMGKFERKVDGSVNYFGEIACAVSGKILVTCESSKDIEFSFVWHMPFVNFHNKKKTYNRYYTKYFGSDSNAGVRMCHYAVTHYKEWEEAINEWQDPIIEDNCLPDWYKSAVFNELYFISDGGSVWLQLNEDELNDLPSNDPRKEYGKFAYLEGHEYRMYNTYDVHFYASFALADLWPKLQLTIQYEFHDAICSADSSLRWFLYDGHFGQRKLPNCVPHDVGDPEEEPFLKINSYPVHDVSDWKDLNLKFVLQCYRDFVYIKDKNYLADMWPRIKLLMDNCLKWDTDNDGMIENSGFPDQTYDCWTMNGVSAYCGSLWLAAVYVTAKMATLLQDHVTEIKFCEILEKGKAVFTEKLWNGMYYDFDSGSPNSKSIMADQLCGIWYLQACGIIDEILPKENVKRALLTVYEFNVQRFCNGESGAVNGMLPSGIIDRSSVQSQEVWTGVTYGLASHLIFQGMKEEGLSTARGIYETVFNKIGLAFCTPEALYEKKYFRSVGYMRPLSIWSVHKALQRLHDD